MAKQEAQYPFLYNNLLSAIEPIFSINKCQIDIKTLSQIEFKILSDDGDKMGKVYNSLEETEKTDNRTDDYFNE